MNTDTTEHSEPGQPLGLALTEQLGLAPKRDTGQRTKETMMDFEQWHLKTVGIPLDSAKARGVADLALMEQCWKEAQDAARTTDRCKCGYPMPCAQTVPIGFCKA